MCKENEEILENKSEEYIEAADTRAILPSKTFFAPGEG